MRSCLPACPRGPHVHWTLCNNKWYGVNPRSGSLASLLFARTNITRHTHATFKAALHCKPRGKAAQYEVIWLWNPGHATKIHHTVRRSCLHLWALQGRKELPHVLRIPQLKAANGMKWSGCETLDTLLIPLQMLGYFCARWISLGYWTEYGWW